MSEKTRQIEYYDVGNGTGKYGNEVSTPFGEFIVGDKLEVPESIAEQMVEGGGYRFADIEKLHKAVDKIKQKIMGEPHRDDPES